MTQTTATKPAGGKPAVAEENKNLPATTNANSLANVDYGEDAGGGFENQTRDDMSLPFVSLLQPNSPEVVKSDGVMRGGTWFNKITGEFWEGKTGFPFIPAITEHCYTQWKIRNTDGSGGGFVARHELEDPLSKIAREKAPFASYPVGDGTQMSETFYVFGNMVDENGLTTPVGLAFGSTHIKPYKSWMYIARSIQIKTPSGGKQNPPLFAHRYRLTSILSPKSSASQMWFVPVINFDGPDAEHARLAPNDPLYIETRAIRDAYQQGNIKADYSKTAAGDVQGEAQQAQQGGSNNNAGNAAGAGGKAPF